MDVPVGPRGDACGSVVCSVLISAAVSVVPEFLANGRDEGDHRRRRVAAKVNKRLRRKAAAVVAQDKPRSKVEREIASSVRSVRQVRKAMRETDEQISARLLKPGET